MYLTNFPILTCPFIGGSRNTSGPPSGGCKHTPFFLGHFLLENYGERSFCNMKVHVSFITGISIDRLYTKRYTWIIIQFYVEWTYVHMSLKNIVFCRKITFIRIKEMRIILSYEEMSLFNIRCLRLNFIFLLREFWNDIIIPNFISKKKKQNKKLWTTLCLWLCKIFIRSGQG